MDPNLLLGPVEHRRERDYFCVLHLLEVRLYVVLGAIGGDDLGDTLVHSVSEKDTLYENLLFENQESFFGSEER